MNDEQYKRRKIAKEQYHKMEDRKERKGLVDEIENLLADYRDMNGGDDLEPYDNTIQSASYWILMRCREMIKNY